MAAGLGWAGPGSGGEGVKVVINKQRRGAHVDVSTKFREISQKQEKEKESIKTVL